MVRCSAKYFLPVLVLAVFSLNGCGNDIFGLFGSNDLSVRWKERDNFHFLKDSDRNIQLGDEYSFIVLSDTHIYKGDPRGFDKLKNVIDSDVKFVVVNGDITQNGKSEDIKMFIEVAESLGIPCYPVVGNHEIYFGNWPAWKELIGSTCYRISGDTATLLMLDSANGYFGKKQLDWLENELKKPEGRVFVFFHANLFTESIVEGQQFTDIRERARITSLFKGKSDAVFTGHVHKRIVKELDGVQYITTEDYWHNLTYCQVWVSKDGIRWEFKKL